MENSYYDREREEVRNPQNRERYICSEEDGCSSAEPYDHQSLDESGERWHIDDPVKVTAVVTRSLITVSGR